ncbi:HAD family hydrolase [Novosphingobium mangrovi (ex Hu et al. 2023)]|uniref:HAD family hydrolase n=1 Tax=Novosphingobium mangrovi (ex Hu et al. 2023) TaxID=2930094 RepID=A0ABT0ABZ2_9SPHN|nr:HAD family hydrolase [Novosphingobium mangrovi (ex Hu et al. 2023)]MCJ1960708.1 HAD family hydrolase [Novosphingobium mangrovi (ex Hu et al. 2023)]
MADPNLPEDSGRLDLTGRVLVLDLDDTLYLERDFAFSGFAALEPLVLQRTGRKGFARACRTLFEAGLRGTIFNEALKELGAGGEQELIGELVAAYRAHDPQIALAADAARFLARAICANCALISDGPAGMQRSKVRALGLDERLGRIVLTGELGPGCGKPHPLGYALVEEWSQRPPEAHVYIADNAAKDFLEPRRRGWTTIQVLRPDRVHRGAAPTLAHRAHHVVGSLDGLTLRRGTASVQ